MSTITRYKRKARTDTTRLLAVEPSASLGMPLPWDRNDGSVPRVLLHVGEPDEHPWLDWRDAYLDAAIALCDRIFGALAHITSPQRRT